MTHRVAVAAIARFAAVLLLVGVVAAGVRRPQLWTGTSGGGLWPDDRANQGDGAAIWPLIVAGVLVLLLLGLSRRRRRRPEGEQVHSETPIPWTAKALAVTILLALIATLVVVLWYLLHSSQWPTPTGDAGAAEPGIPPGQPPAVDQPNPPESRLWWPIVAAGVTAVALLLAGWAMSAARRFRPATAPAAATPAATDALAAGTAALREPADDRDAVIACYAAMERELGERGLRRSPAQTPTELLAQATDACLIHTPPARELIDLFHQARHSSRPMGPAQRRSAERALSTLSDDLMSAR